MNISVSVSTPVDQYISPLESQLGINLKPLSGREKTVEKKKKFVSDEEFHAALESMRPWWDEVAQIMAIKDETSRRDRSRDFVVRWSTFRNNTIGNAWGRIYPFVMAPAINGKRSLEVVGLFLEEHQVRLASAWKQGCELTGVEPPLHDEIGLRDYEGNVPKVVELLGALRKKLNEIRAAKPVVVVKNDDFIDEIFASADTEVEKNIKWTKNVLFDYNLGEGDFDAVNRQRKRERARAIKEAREARKDMRSHSQTKIEKAPIPQPVPDPRVELETRVKELETALAAARTNKVTAAESDDDEALAKAVAEVKKIASELETVRTELWALDATKTIPVTAVTTIETPAPEQTLQFSTLERVLNRVGDFVPTPPPNINGEEVRKALEAFVASAESGRSESKLRMIETFLADPNKRPDWIVSKALNAVSKGTASVAASA